MNLADWSLNSNYPNLFDSIKPILFTAYYMLGTVLGTGDGETIRTEIDPALRELKVSFSKYLLYA